MMTTEEKRLTAQSLSEESDLEREIAAKWSPGYPLQKRLSFSNVWEIWIWLFPPECNDHFICLLFKVIAALQHLGMRNPSTVSSLGGTFTPVVLCKVGTTPWIHVSFQFPCSCSDTATTGLWSWAGLYSNPSSPAHGIEWATLNFLICKMQTSLAATAAVL